MDNFLFTILSFTIYRSALPLGSTKNLIVSPLKTKPISQLANKPKTHISGKKSQVSSGC